MPSSFDASSPNANNSAVAQVMTAAEMESAIEAQQPVQADLMQNKIEDEATLILSYTDTCKAS